jgi:hypothetical protein
MKRNLTTLMAIATAAGLPKMVTRRMPGVGRFGYAAYKSDGKSPELEALEKLDQNMETRYKELKDELATKTKELGDLKAFNDDQDKKIKEYETNVKELNGLLGDKGATLKQIQDEVKELQAKAGAMKVSIPENKMNVKDLFLKEFETAAENAVKEYRADVHNNVNTALPFMRTKAVGTMTISSNITGASISAVPTWDNNFASRGRQLVHFRDLVRTIDTTTGLYIFLRQNIPAGEGSVAATTQPGATKTKRDYDNTMVTVTSKYRAGTVDVATEMLQDIPGLSQYITEELTEDYLRTETFDFFDTLVTGATGSSSLPVATTVTAEKIAYWVANLEQNNYQPDTIVVRPAVWAMLLNTKPQDYSRPGGYLVLPDGTIIFAGLRLTKCSTNAIADNKVLVGDFRKALITQKAGEGFNVRMFNTHDQAVYANLITFRGEARAEVAVMRPDAFVYGGIGTT